MFDDHDFDIASTLRDFYEDCLLNGFSLRTVISYRSSLRIWQDFLDKKGITSLTEVSNQILHDYRRYLQTSYLSPKGNRLSIATQAQKLAALRSYLKFCARVEKTMLNANQALLKPKLPQSLPRRIVNKRQMKKLLKAPDISTPTGFRDRIILELLYSTGMHREELSLLEVRDCHLEERRIFIRNGKGGKQRWVPVARQVSVLLRQYLEQIRPLLVNGKNHDYLLVAAQGGRMYGPRIYLAVKKYLNQLGINSDCHGIRHSCATHLLQGKANIRTIQSLLGHQSLSSTQIYPHIDIDDMARAIEKAHPRASMHCDDERE